jgi:hypothetical protein
MEGVALGAAASNPTAIAAEVGCVGGITMGNWLGVELESGMVEGDVWIAA